MQKLRAQRSRPSGTPDGEDAEDPVSGCGLLQSGRSGLSPLLHKGKDSAACGCRRAAGSGGSIQANLKQRPATSMKNTEAAALKKGSTVTYRNEPFFCRGTERNEKGRLMILLSKSAKGKITHTVRPDSVVVAAVIAGV